MARKKLSYIKKVSLVGGIIVLGQLVWMWRLKATEPTIVSLKEYMANMGDDTSGASAEQRAYTRIQIALSDYRIKTGSYPEELDTLVPDYFDAVPTDPNTNAPFAYELYRDTFKLGSKGGAKGKKQDGNKGLNLPHSLSAEVMPGSDDERQLLIASLNQDTTNAKIYDPTGKRDPFMVYDFSPKQASSIGKTPLERATYDKLRLSAVLLGFEPKAIIELDGKGYTVSIGDKIGNLGGVIKKIEQKKVTILESVIDFTGEKKNRIVELKIVDSFKP